MVKQEKRAHLFLGRDTIGADGVFRKDACLARLRQGLPAATRDFNIDTLHVQDRDFSLRALQEKLLFVPAAAGSRLVLVRGIEAAKPDVRSFLLSYVRDPSRDIILVLDAPHPKPDDDFIDELAQVCQVTRFDLDRRENTFALADMLERKQGRAALTMLRRLLDQGEKPERIVGALRSGLLRRCFDQAAARKRLRLLLETDLEIKTGRLSPACALEKMVVSFLKL